MNLSHDRNGISTGTPKTSVIIPTYNRAHVLGRAVHSVLRQTQRDIEIIIIDDASTDHTDEVVKTINDDRILYIKHNERKGASSARNSGIDIARGEYVAFLDSDDEWIEDKLERQLEVFYRSPETLGLVYSGCVEIAGSKEDRPVIPKVRGSILKNLLVNNCVGYMVTPLVRRECFSKAGLFDDGLPGSQDWDMWIRIAQHYTIDFVSDVLVRVYPQEDGIMRNSAGAVSAHKRILQKYEHLLKSMPRGIRAKRYYYEGIFFWWHRDLASSFRYLSKSVLLNPLHLIDILLYCTRKAGEKLMSSSAGKSGSG